MRQLGPLRPLLLWTGLILLVVVPWYSWQTHPHWERVQWRPFIFPLKIRDVIGNVLLYFPFGYWAQRRWPNRTVGALVGMAMLLSFATELTQVYSHLRYPSAQDVVSNVFGAWLGTGLGIRGRKSGGELDRTQLTTTDKAEDPATG